jgi:predicted ester cyclase
MSLEENKAVSNRAASVASREDLDTFDELYAPNLAEKFKQDVAEIRRAFPGYHGTTVTQIAERDLVVNRFVY